MFKISLYLNYFVFSILLSSIGIVILKAQQFYQVNEMQAGILEIFKDLSIMVFSFISASLLPKVGYRKAMLIGIAAVCLACMSMASFLGTYFWMPKLLFATIGASFALIKISIYSSIGIVTSGKKEHKRVMGSIEGVFMFGVAIAYFLFPAFNKQDNPTAWLRVYWLLAGISFISFVFLIFSKSKKVELATGHLKEDFSSMFNLIKNPFIVAFVLSTFLFVMIEQSIMSWLPTFNKKVLHLDENVAIMTASILAILIGLGRMLSSYLARYAKWIKTLSFCIIMAMGLIVFVLYNINQFHFIAYIFPFVGLFMAPIPPLINSNILTTLPKSMQSHMSGLITIFSATGGVIGSRLTGFLFKTIGGENAFYYILIPMALLLITLFILHKKTNKNKMKLI